MGGNNTRWAREAGPNLSTVKAVTAGVKLRAEAGHADAQARWGQLLLDAGRAREAFRWFAQAAGQGHAKAINMIGRCYDLGWGTPIDKTRAAECFRRAAEAGLDWGMYNYATALALGEGLTADKDAALEWFDKAATMGNAKTVNHIGNFHEDGLLVGRDMARAARCYARSAEAGYFRGQFNHARMLMDKGNAEEAHAWLRRCTETATPAFVARSRLWLRKSRWPELEAILA